MTAPSYVQSAIINDTSTGATTGPVSLTGCGANSLLVLAVSSLVSAGVSSVSDGGAGLTWRQAGRQATGGQGVEVWYALFPAGGNISVSVTWAASDAGCLALHEYSGAKSMIYQVMDVVAGAGATSATPSATTAATAYSDDLVFGAATWASGNPTVTAGSSCTLRQSFANAGLTAPLATDDKTVAATGAQTASFSLGGSSLAWAHLTVTFKGSTAPTRPRVLRTVPGNGTGTPAALTFPTAPTPGNLMIVAISARGDARASLAGWTELDFVTGATAGNIGLTILYRVAQAGDAAGTSFTLSSGQRWGGYKVEIADFDDSAAAAWQVGHTTTQNSGSRTTDTTGSITPSVGDCLILVHFGIATGAVTGNAPASPWSELADVSNTTTSTSARLVAHGSEQGTAAAINGGITWSGSTSVTGCDQIVAVAPPSSGVTGTGDATIGAPALDGSGTATSYATGTGDVAVGAPALGGTGTFATTGAGAVSIGSPSLAGTGVMTTTGAGAVSIGSPSLAAAGMMETTGSGAVGIGAPALAAAGTVEAPSGGFVTIGPPSMAGTGDFATTGAGAAVIGPPSLAGSGAMETTGSGALALGAPALAGSGAMATTGSGALAIGHPAIAGSGTVADPGTGSGALTIGGPVLAGTGAMETTGSGALALGPPVLVGAGDVIALVVGTGALLVGPPRLSGVGVVVVVFVGTGAVLIGPPVIAGVSSLAVVVVGSEAPYGRAAGSAAAVSGAIGALVAMGSALGAVVESGSATGEDSEV